MAASVHSEDGGSGFQIAPRVDVVFVLLLFFMAIAGSQKTEKGIKVDLPGRPAPSDASAITVYQIDISADGEVAFNGLKVGEAGLSALKERLKTLTTTPCGGADRGAFRFHRGSP